MKVALVDEMRKIDQRAVAEFGVAELVLMENAGHRTAEAVAELLGSIREKNICVLAGSGNNGGDAFAAARHLANGGAKVKVFFIGDLTHLTKSATINRRIVQNMEIELHSLEGERSWDRLQVVLRFSDVLVDGVLGTGFKGDLRADIRRLVKLVNSMGKPVVAIDVPTGVAADTGQVDGDAVQAACTVALGLPKPGHLLCPGGAMAGKILVDDIGIPSVLLGMGIRQSLLDDELASTLIPPRPIDAHKGTCGRFLVIAGSSGMSGAAVMAAQAVLRAGAGTVTLAVPASLHELMEVKLTEVMTCPIPELEPGIMGGDDSLGVLLQMVDKYDAVLMGPGMGRREETLDLIRNLAEFTSKPLILDADAVYAFRGHLDKLKECKQIPILTPHLGEMAALLEVTVQTLRSALLESARKMAKDYQAVFVVKSECTLTVYPDEEVFFSTQGNPGMATAGSGDVLAGTILGLMKQTESGLAPLAGVYLHGKAGCLAAEEFGEGLIASDILNKLPQARRYLQGYKS